MTNLYPNVFVALDMNARLCGSFKNAKSRFKKWLLRLNKRFTKKKKLWLGFYSVLEWVLWVGFFVPTLYNIEELKAPC